MYMEMDMTDRAYEIMSKLENNVNEIFLEEQNRLGIASGDISPMVDYDMTLALEKLAQIIDFALMEQEQR